MTMLEETFNFRLCLGGWAPSVTWNLRGTDFFQASGAPDPSSDGQEVGVEKRQVWSERAWVLAVVLLMKGLRVCKNNRYSFLCPDI